MGLQLAIKKDWQQKIKSHNFEFGRCLIGSYVTINNILKSLYKLTSQLLYWELINLKSKGHSSLDTWVHLFPFLENIEWKIIFTLSNRVTCESYLQTFQYKVLNRTLNCRYNLYNWKISESPVCTYCNAKQIDTIEHHLILCCNSAEFWNRMKI